MLLSSAKIFDGVPLWHKAVCPKRVTCCIFATILSCIPAAGQSMNLPKGASKCTGIQAYADDLGQVYSDDFDFTGVNVRSAPDLKAPIIGTLKKRFFGRDAYLRPFFHSPRFDVIASYQGWLLVKDYAYPDGETEPPLPASPGWIHGSQIRVESFGFGKQKTYLYRHKKGVGLIGAIDQVGGMDFALIGCDSSWAEVQQRIWIQADRKERKGIRGWLAAKDICSEQPTRRQIINICDGRW